jgi:Subtilisin-like serine proteases
MSVSKMNALFAFLLVIFIALTASTVQCQQLRRGSIPIQSSRNLKASKSDNKTSKAASPKSSKEASKKSPKGSSPSKKTSSKSIKSSKSSTTSGGNNLELGIIDINPTSAGPGHLVQIKHNILNQGDDFNQSDLEVIFNGGQLSVGPESVTENTVTFLVPNDLEQGDATLALRMGNTVSNAVLFFVSDGISIVSPDPGKIVLGEDGVGVAVNLVMVFVANGFDVDTVTNEITSQFGGNVVGQIDALRARQLEVPTETLGELQNIIDQITARDDIESAVMDFLHTPEEQVTVDWTADPGSPGQHESNRVREGVQAYIDNIHPTREGAIVPGFRSIVVLESAVDFTQDDFSGYRDDGSSRSGGIGLYAAGLDPDDMSPSFHGTNVVGMIAAELNDGSGAGLLRAVGEADAHGGFNIKVAKPVATHTWAAEVAMGLESGARLFNLSAGQHKCLEFDTGATTKTCIDGPFTSVGDIVQNNLVSVTSFEAWQAVFNKVVLLMEREYPDAIMVVSAGNGDTDTGDENVRLYSSNPSNQVIVVGAHTNDAMPARASYSNYGERVDIAASGTVMASGGDSTTVEGTSYAAPLVVATIAAMRSIEPNLSPVEVLHRYCVPQQLLLKTMLFSYRTQMDLILVPQCLPVNLDLTRLVLMILV